MSVDVTTLIKVELARQGKKLIYLSEKMGISPQNLSGKLKRNNPTINELSEIADILNCDLKIELIEREK